MNEKKVRKAVIPATGLGTRFLPATKARRKKCSDRRQTSNPIHCRRGRRVRN